VPAGWEYSGRGGARVYTQCLIVAPPTLARFANNPFALTRAALAAGSLRCHDEVPKSLPPLRLTGRAPVVNPTLLARLCTDPGPDRIAALVETALTSRAIAVTGGPKAEQVIAGLINCLPLECRLEFSFSTGLKFSSRRPFRVVAVSSDLEERRRIERLYEAALLDLSGELPEDYLPRESWARFIHRVLKRGRPSLLSSKLSNLQCACPLEDLPALGLQMLEELDASCSQSAPSDELPQANDLGQEDLNIAGPRSEQTSGDRDAAGQHLSPRPAEHGPSAGEPWPSSDALPQAHQAHRGFQEDASTPVASSPQGAAPSRLLDTENPDLVRKLEHLDDLVYGAVNGKPTAMEELRAYWPRVQDELGGPLLAESQEEYLRYALSVWSDAGDAEAPGNPGRSVEALEVLTLLLDES
jgi:hypothetical protein